MKKNDRIWELDALRGVCILCVIAVHLIYDLGFFIGLDLHLPAWYVFIQQYGGVIFVILSGCCATLGSRSFRRGCIVFACGLLISLVTFGMYRLGMATRDVIVWFGVLHLLGCAALLTCLLHPALEKLPPLAGVTGSAVLFALLNQLPQGWLGFEGTHLAALPAAWYKPNLFWLGLPDLTVFSSSDYFPLLPWVFLYWVGYFFARWFRARCTAQPGLPPKALRPLCAVGSRTLLIYMLHQPVIYGALLGLRYLGFV